MKQLSEQHQKFIKALFEHRGNVTAASEAVGYDRSNGYRLMHVLRETILEQAQHILALHASRAVYTLVEGIEVGGEVPTNPLRIKCAEAILDRIGISKKDKLEISGDANAPLFILPSKQSDGI